MDEEKLAELDSLLGLHKLDAVDVGSMKVKTWGDDEGECNTLSFRLDGIVYTAVEDPNDGYRSSMKKLLVEKKRLKNKFTAIKVVGIKKPPSSYQENDTLQFYDAITGKLVLEVGTDNTDDYYPYFVATFIPENMATNVKSL